MSIASVWAGRRGNRCGGFLWRRSCRGGKNFLNPYNFRKPFMYDKSTINFYKWIFFTALLPYADRFIPIFPDNIWGFNLSGFAWIIIFVVSLIRVLVHIRSVAMPGWLWMPWIAYLIFQWVQDLSFLGLQATLQYMVFPIAGMAASTYRYSDETMAELKRWFG